MKASNTKKNKSKKIVQSKSTKNKVVSKITRKTKRFGKQTLRDLLLSKTFHTAFKIVVGFMISASAMYGVYAYIGNTFANDVVVSKSEILIRVAKHIKLPTGEPEAVVRVQDANTLKTQNDFYSNVKEGDYVIIYSNLAIIYDLLNDNIIAFKYTER